MSDIKETKETTELSKVLDFDSKDAIKYERTSGTKVPSGKSSSVAWLEAWFKLNEVQYRFDGNHLIKDESKSFGVRRVNSETLYNNIYVGTGISGGKEVRPLIRSFIKNWEDNGKQLVLSETVENISYRPELKDSKLIEQFVVAMTGESDFVDIAVIENFIHSVKRKMIGKEAKIDLFPILRGKQNSGKSTAVRNLLTPVEQFWTDRSLDMLNQEKNLKVLGTKFVIFFDEMARAKRTDINALKKHTTGKSVSFRRYYTQEEDKIPNISTFIGCTNNPVSEIIRDSGGSRRFYELQTLDKMDWGLINQIDYLELWQSVDENMEYPLLSNDDYREELSKRQAKIKWMDSVEEFLSFKELMPIKDEDTMEVTFSDLYKAYSKWMKDQSMMGRFKEKNFALRLNELGVESKRKSDARYRVIRKCDFYTLLPQV